MFPHTERVIRHTSYPLVPCGKYRVAFKTSYKTEYRSGIGNERDGFNCGGEQSNIWGNQGLCTGTYVIKGQ